MALSAEAIISIVGTIINLPSCVLAFYHMCRDRRRITTGTLDISNKDINCPDK
ncbi:hypothetical protein BFJ65_g3800 [Fusarium oxysporum f. sp. cepae]|uniref:Uncharacterized protein n=1 Tax=Fusarium oxysporum f. sp. cepae TaxID=396571 RepID=A0A3L6P3A5_FUSOX|nr:hypothetical protein BFJ65_g3800 [Fusarium oxysporum f. sp. cepae]RKK62446.1 hypothetical protein BFJ67_g1390 [Fusarium oxysporum f. sp. cepae]